MEFVQIVEFNTSRIDEIEALAEKLRVGDTAAASAPPALICADRDNPNRYMVIAEFPDYDTAMANSNRPEVSEFAASMAELCDGPPKFYNLDLKRRM